MDAPEKLAAQGYVPDDAFRGSVAVVTGGGTGLGLQISRGLAARGADVTILSRSAEHHAALLAEGERMGWRVAAECVDVRQAKDVDRAGDRLLERTGRVDILVNNAAGNFVCPE